MSLFVKRLRACCSSSFKFMKVFFQVIYGSWKIAALSKPRITIFGGSRLGQKSEFAQKAFDLAQQFVNQGISVITGGGSGVMHAANCGAISKVENGAKKYRDRC